MISLEGLAENSRWIPFSLRFDLVNARQGGDAGSARRLPSTTDGRGAALRGLVLAARASCSKPGPICSIWKAKKSWFVIPSGH